MFINYLLQAVTLGTWIETCNIINMVHLIHINLSLASLNSFQENMGHS